MSLAEQDLIMFAQLLTMSDHITAMTRQQRARTTNNANDIIVNDERSHSPKPQYFSRNNSVLRIPIAPRHSKARAATISSTIDEEDMSSTVTGASCRSHRSIDSGYSHRDSNGHSPHDLSPKDTVCTTSEEENVEVFV